MMPQSPLRPRVFIDGEYGTTGLQIKQRLAGRDDLEMVSIAPERRKDDGERARLLNDVDVAILCLPDDAARAAVAAIRNPGVRVLDASTAHRVHPDWVYGFPEMREGQADEIRAARRVANPGCYPTGMIALVRPLVDAGLLPPDYPVTVSALSGYSGAGRAMIDAFEGRGETRVTDAARVYGLNLRHKHVPEMHTYGALSRAPVFLPTMGDYAQGMIVEMGLHLDLLRSGVTGTDLHAALEARYSGARFIEVKPLAAEIPYLEPEALNGTNRMELFLFENSAARQVLLIARLDNLGKGASGAAVQNLDLMLGLDSPCGRDYTLPQKKR